MKTISWFGLVLCALSAAGKVFIGKVGERVTLQCGDSSSIQSVEWKRGEKLVWRSTDKRGMISKEKGNDPITARSVIKGTNLQITGLKEEDAGPFTCHINGKPNQYTLGVVSVWVKPASPLTVGSTAAVHCKVNLLDESSTVELLKPDGSKTNLMTELKPVASSHKGVWSCKVTSQGEQFFTNLTINVQAPKTTTSSSVITSTKPSSSSNSSKHLLKLSWWVWTAIGVGVLAVTVLIISVVVTCKRVRRRKRKFLRMKHAQQQQRPKKFCQCERQTAAAKPQQGRRREKPSALPLQPLLKE